MQNILKLQLAVFPVFEPFLSRLVAPDIKLLGYLRHMVEVLGIVDIDPTFRTLFFKIRYY
ncbi:hypothetical protein [Eisenibacter elegans]|uniref:hypothetical protein n=1 Tax=Eisenibacter elegans TaxID=997 RepID=UPI000427A0B4|nr:hypothetical protein [Eisenibacter elegans]